MTKAQINQIIYDNKKRNRKEFIEALIGAIAIFTFGYLWFMIAV